MYLCYSVHVDNSVQGGITVSKRPTLQSDFQMSNFVLTNQKPDENCKIRCDMTKQSNSLATVLEPYVGHFPTVCQ